MNAGQYQGLMGILGQILDRMPERPQCAEAGLESCGHGCVEGRNCAGPEPAQYDPGPTVLSPAGWPVKLTDTRTPVKLTDPDHRAAASLALYSLLVNLDGWIEGAHSNHEALGHRGESTDARCWTQFHPDDIRRMINDVARELGLSEFPTPEVPKEDTFR